ncbi:MAG: hypothetical protein R2827_10305 [Bdellovibrionales bacterium]
MNFLKKLLGFISNPMFIGITLSLVFAYLTLDTLGQIITYSKADGIENLDRFSQRKPCI